MYIQQGIFTADWYVRYNIFTNGAPYRYSAGDVAPFQKAFK